LKAKAVNAVSFMKKNRTGRPTPILLWRPLLTSFRNTGLNRIGQPSRLHLKKYFLVGGVQIFC